MPSRRMRLHRMAGGLRMRSRDNLIRLRDTKLRRMGVSNYPSLLSIPVLLALIILLAWLRTPQTTKRFYLPVEEAFKTPLAGWALRADTWGTDDRLDVSLVYAEVTWAELESAEGEYDFAAFEEKNHLNEWWADGKRLILRFVCDRPGEAGHMDIPEWLVEDMGGIPLAGSFYETETGGGFAPDYSSLVMREAHRKVIAAIADRYDDHPGVAYIELGSLGQDGEWTVDMEAENIEKLPTSTISREYAWHYTSSFENTLMLMRRPYKETQLLSVGLYNPDLGDFEATWNYLHTIETGGYDRQIETDLVAMPGFHNYSPSGAHISGEVDIEALLAEHTPELSRQIGESNLDYVVLEHDIASLSDKAVSRIGDLDVLIGYRMWLRSAEWDSSLRAGIRSKVKLIFRNDGTSPMHAGWPVALALFDGNMMLCQEVTELDTAMILPGDNALTAWIDIPVSVDVGAYSLRLAVLDPDSGEPGVQLGNEECNEETLWMELGTLNVIG